MYKLLSKIIIIIVPMVLKKIALVQSCRLVEHDDCVPLECNRYLDVNIFLLVV